jgi:hypothetical protein
MKTSPALIAALLLAAIGGPVLASEEAGPGVEDPVYVDTTDILYLESFPVQVRLVVAGSLPTPCHEASWEVETSADGIDVRLWSTADPDAICVGVLEPVEVSIPLGSFETADLPVTLNGEPVGRVTVGTASTPGASPTPTMSSLVGAGWSFGMCAGFCVADLVIDGDRLVLTGAGHRPEETLFENHGSLTPAGRTRIDDALQALGDTPLEPVYGCPDCADGGAAYLSINRDGVASRHETEFGDPPAELAELDAFAKSLIDALQQCAANDLVEVGDDCVPYERRTRPGLSASDDARARSELRQDEHELAIPVGVAPVRAVIGHEVLSEGRGRDLRVGRS